MHDDVSTYFALVYRRREPVLVMKRVKRDAMFRPSWKFEGKQNSIPAQFFVLCFRVFLGGLRFRGLRFLGGLCFRGLRFLGGLRFRGLRFLRGLPFRGLWSSVFGLRFLDTPLVTTPGLTPAGRQSCHLHIDTSIRSKYRNCNKLPPVLFPPRTT